MREIIFRGRKVKDGKLVCGNLYKTSTKYHKIPELYILPDSILYRTCSDGDHFYSVFAAYRVEANSIGQYTGLKDKNGTKIFEGDILKDNDVYFTVFYADGGFAIESNPTYFGYGYQGNSNPRESLSDMQTGSYIESNCVVIGNIHDNKELLK